MTTHVIEKDWALGWVLAGIGAEPALSTWVFKGGASLRKCYYETYRFSEDLDFTVVDGGLDDPEFSLGRHPRPITRSRCLANEVKSVTAVMVVIGNPPYRERAKAHGGFIEHGSPNTVWAERLVDAFREPSNGPGPREALIIRGFAASVASGHAC